MTEHNHRHGTKRRKYRDLIAERKAWAVSGAITSVGRHSGKPWNYLDKSMSTFGVKSMLADKHIGAGIGNDFTDGNRGMAHAVRGAKKFVRSRFRFHENAATRLLASSYENE